jgi:hypothetical protein
MVRGKQVSIGNLIAAACMLTAIVVAYVVKRARPVYLLDFHVFKPADELKMPHEVFLQRTRLCEVRGRRAGVPLAPRALAAARLTATPALPAARRAPGRRRCATARRTRLACGEGGRALTAAGRRAARRASRPPAWPSRRRWWPRAAWATRLTCRTVRAAAPGVMHAGGRCKVPLPRSSHACTAGRRCRRPALWGRTRCLLRCERRRRHEVPGCPHGAARRLVPASCWP